MGVRVLYSRLVTPWLTTWWIWRVILAIVNILQGTLTPDWTIISYVSRKPRMRITGHKLWRVGWMLASWYPIKSFLQETSQPFLTFSIVPLALCGYRVMCAKGLRSTYNSWQIWNSLSFRYITSAQNADRRHRNEGSACRLESVLASRSVCQ